MATDPPQTKKSFYSDPPGTANGKTAKEKLKKYVVDSDSGKKALKSLYDELDHEDNTIELTLTLTTNQAGCYPPQPRRKAAKGKKAPQDKTKTAK